MKAGDLVKYTNDDSGDFGIIVEVETRGYIPGVHNPHLSRTGDSYIQFQWMSYDGSIYRSVEDCLEVINESA